MGNCDQCPSGKQLGTTEVVVLEFNSDLEELDTSPHSSYQVSLVTIRFAYLIRL